MTDQLKSLADALADRYRIVQELGSGGMATVYLAEDLRHGRQVAVKVVKPELAAALGPDRFTREIKIAARLQHPHILPLHDSGESDGFLYYVMPFVQGESVRERIDKHGELPISDAVRIVREVVDALAYAHEQGLIHRDIKPDNVMLSGRHALVMDFGVAKAVTEATGKHEVTTAGVALGTPSYMAPEQATADPTVDHRADIYAVGAMAYELLTGRPPFLGNTPQVILSAHVTETPMPISQRRPAVSRGMEHVIMRCLEKRPADRWQSSRELLNELEALATPSGGTTPTTTRPIAAVRLSKARRWLPWVGIAVLAYMVVGLLTSLDSSSGVRTGRVTHLTAAPGLEVDPVISPDLNMIAYAAGPPGQMKIYVRQIAGGRTIPLVEDLEEHHRWPQWSPDGSRLLFQAGGDYVEASGGVRALGSALLTVPALGGAVRRVVDPRPGTSLLAAVWSPDGQHIAYVEDSVVVIDPVSGNNQTRRVTAGFQPHSIQWSPDGSKLAYVSGNQQFTLGTSHIANVAPSSIWIMRVDDGSTSQITFNDAMNVSPTWMPDSRQLLFVSSVNGSRDVYRMRLTRAGAPSGEPERVTTGLNAHTIALAADGRTLAYSVYTSYTHVWSVRMPRQGVVSVADAEQVTFGGEGIEGLTLSPDHTEIAYDSDRSGNFDVWRVTLGNGIPQQVTTHPSNDFVQQWSPDGSELAIHTFRNGNRDVYVIAADGSSPQQVTDGPAQELNPTWSPDGNAIAFQSDATGRSELYVTRRSGPGQPWGEPVQITTQGGVDPYWSPTGDHLAFIVDRSVSVIAAEGGEPRVVVRSTDLATEPVPEFAIWSEDGRTIFYKAYDEQRRSSIWSVPLAGGQPTLLVRFDDPSRPSFRREFDTDGERFYFTIARHESDIWIMELLSN